MIESSKHGPKLLEFSSLGSPYCVFLGVVFCLNFDFFFCFLLSFVPLSGGFPLFIYLFVYLFSRVTQQGKAGWEAFWTTLF